MVGTSYDLVLWKWWWLLGTLWFPSNSQKTFKIGTVHAKSIPKAIIPCRLIKFGMHYLQVMLYQIYSGFCDIWNSLPAAPPTNGVCPKIGENLRSPSDPVSALIRMKLCRFIACNECYNFASGHIDRYCLGQGSKGKMRQMDETGKDKTAFSMGIGLYQFTVMPLGLWNTPDNFEWFMHVCATHWPCVVISQNCVANS